MSALAKRIRETADWIERHPRAIAALCVAIAAAVFAPPIVFQYRHVHLGWADVGSMRRANYYFFEHGRLSETIKDPGLLARFVLDGPVRHVVPFFVLLSGPVWLFDTAGYETLITAALIAASAYVFALGRRVCGSSWIGLLCALAYVANPYTYAVDVSSHFETFGVLFLVGFAYHNYAGQTGRAWLMLALALTVKEDMWVYVAIAALLTARRERAGRSAAFIAAAAAYFVMVIHPASRLLLRDRGSAVPGTEWAIAMSVLGRWRELPRLLFAGPGLPFQASFLFLGYLSWRQLPVLGVLALWLTLPGGSARTELGVFYSFPVLALSFIALPFAVKNLGWLADRAGRAPARAGTAIVTLAMAAVIAVDVRMHLPGHVPPAIVSVVEPGQVYSQYPFVKGPQIRYLVAKYLPPEAGSVLAQFYTIAAIRERPGLYLTGDDKDSFLNGSLRPDNVLLDLGAVDPGTPPWQDRAIALALRADDSYEMISDADGVLLYRRRR